MKLNRHYLTNPVQLLVMTLAFFAILSCTSGKKAMERGDYYQSVISAVDRLRKNPDHKKSTETLQISYPPLR